MNKELGELDDNLCGFVSMRDHFHIIVIWSIVHVITMSSAALMNDQSNQVIIKIVIDHFLCSRISLTARALVKI